MQIVNPLAKSTAPVREIADLGAKNRIPVRYDKRTLFNENVTANQLELFQPDSPRDLNRNYRNNPFQGNQRKKVLGVGLYLPIPFVLTEAANNVYARDVAEALQLSAVTVGKGNRKTIIHRLSTQQLVDFTESGLVTGTYDNGTNADDFELYHFKIQPGALLHDQDMILDPDERFHMTLHLPEGYSLPAQSDWSAADQYAAKIGANVQFERL